VIHVNDEGAGKPSMMMNSPKLSKEENVREWIGKAGFEAESKAIPIIIVEGGDYAGEIASQTKSVDLLIIGHKHRSRFLAAISDSTDVEVTNQVSCSVLIVPMR
jgi:nucleotide-binding universal stress UspA family protein